MAGGWGKKKSKKNCEDCKRLSNPDNFAKGSRVKIFEVLDCENCEVMKHQPIEENENIIELYNILPDNYDAFGVKIISVGDIKCVLELFGVPKEIWDDHYSRIAYFHRMVLDVTLKTQANKAKKEKSMEDWKRERLESKRVH